MMSSCLGEIETLHDEWSSIGEGISMQGRDWDTLLRGAGPTSCGSFTEKRWIYTEIFSR